MSYWVCFRAKWCELEPSEITLFLLFQDYYLFIVISIQKKKKLSCYCDIHILAVKHLCVNSKLLKYIQEIEPLFFLVLCNLVAS